jgi:hypothetical protein
LWKPPIAIFRDERVLRTGDDLPSGIRAGLEASDFLIYIASKEAAESDWVKKELRIWCDELKRSNQLLPVHISDRIKVDLETSRLDWQNTEAVPSGIGNLQVLPVWADMTWASKEEQLDLGNVRYKAEINGIVAKLNGVLPGTMNDIEDITHRRNILARNIGIGLVIVSAAVESSSSITWSMELSQRVPPPPHSSPILGFGQCRSRFRRLKWSYKLANEKYMSDILFVLVFISAVACNVVAWWRFRRATSSLTSEQKKKTLAGLLANLVALFLPVVYAFSAMFTPFQQLAIPWGYVLGSCWSLCSLSLVLGALGPRQVRLPLMVGSVAVGVFWTMVPVGVL